MGRVFFKLQALQEFLRGLLRCGQVKGGRLRRAVEAALALLQYRFAIQPAGDHAERKALVQRFGGGAHARGLHGVEAPDEGGVGVVHVGAEAPGGVELLADAAFDGID